MRKYASLKKQVIINHDYSIVPIRDEDKYIIMQMRNAQIFHLRQQKLLTPTIQDHYFAEVVSKLFDIEQPDQILFSFLYNNECIGYGGLVHINWVDKNAELSFIIKPEMEEEYFFSCWKSFLNMIQQVAFEDVKLHKIFTYAFDLRPNLYSVVESCGFYREAVLKDHCFIEDKFIDVVIHSKINEHSNNT
jgi:RimJ/RimL family protein N-acetyltransferase